MPDQVLQQMHSRQRSLEQLLRYTGENAYVRIVVVATDDFSGLRASKQLKVTVQKTSGVESKLFLEGSQVRARLTLNPMKNTKNLSKMRLLSPAI